MAEGRCAPSSLFLNLRLTNESQNSQPLNMSRQLRCLPMKKQHLKAQLRGPTCSGNDLGNDRVWRGDVIGQGDGRYVDGWPEHELQVKLKGRLKLLSRQHPQQQKAPLLMTD